MSVLDKPDNVPVPLGYCPCDGHPHPGGDVVYLYPELSGPGGVAVRALLLTTAGKDAGQVEQELAELWLRVSVAAWTFVDDDGDPIPVDKQNVVLALPYAKGGRLVADKANDLYLDSVLTPLLKEAEKASRAGSTRSSRTATSRRSTSTGKRRSPSSTATTAKVPPTG